MACMVRWLRDCADPACIHMGAEHISSNQFKVDRMKIIVDAKKYIYVSQLFISRMPKMHAVQQYGFGSIKSYTNNCRTSVMHEDLSTFF